MNVNTGKTDILRSLMVAQGAKGRDIRALGLSDQVRVAEHLRLAGVVSEEEFEEACQSRLALAKLLRTHWLPYLSIFVSLYPETDQAV